jgi:hypothetical protein
MGALMRVRLGLLILIGATCLVRAQDSKAEPIYTAANLYNRCSGNSQDRQICFAYIRGFSDGNRWLLRDAPVAPGVVAPQAVCVPNAEPIQSAADLVVARFRGRTSELKNLSPFRALSMSLSQRYPCKE